MKNLIKALILSFSTLLFVGCGDDSQFQQGFDHLIGKKEEKAKIDRDENLVKLMEKFKADAIASGNQEIISRLYRLDKITVLKSVSFTDKNIQIANTSKSTNAPIAMGITHEYNHHKDQSFEVYFQSGEGIPKDYYFPVISASNPIAMTAVFNHEMMHVLGYGHYEGEEGFHSTNSGIQAANFDEPFLNERKLKTKIIELFSEEYVKKIPLK